MLQTDILLRWRNLGDVKLRRTSTATRLQVCCENQQKILCNVKHSAQVPTQPCEGRLWTRTPGSAPMCRS